MNADGIMEMISGILSTIWGWFNLFLEYVIRFFDAVFSFLPQHLRTGFGVVAFVIVGVIIFFLWKRD